jgi:hypothetical protein
MAWSMVLGPAAPKPQAVERTIRQVDMAPSIARWLGFEHPGAPLPEFGV